MGCDRCYHGIMTSQRKTLTVRLPTEQADALAAVARVDGTSVNAAVGTAIDQLIAEKRKDTAFMARLDRYMVEHRELLERLAD